MFDSELYETLAQKKTDIKIIAEKVMHNPALLPEVIAGLEVQKAAIKYGCLKILTIISEIQPIVLYPEFDSFVSLLDHENNFIKWGAIIITANLTVVDSQRKFEPIFNRYFSPIPGPVMITAGNTMRGGAIIARAKPELTTRIVKEILKVEHAQYKTTECLNIALGHAINAFDHFFDQVHNKIPVMQLVEKQLNNTRSSTKKKAEKFIKKWRDKCD